MQGAEGNLRFNLHAFWVDHKNELPLHYGVYMTEVGCIRAAAASVETVFSGAGKFTQEAPLCGSQLLRMIVRNHTNWQYFFIRPTVKQVVARYNKKHHPNLGTAGAAAGMEAAANLAEGTEAASPEVPAPAPAAPAPDAGESSAAAMDAAAAAAAAGAIAKAAAAAALANGADAAGASAAAAAAIADADL